MKILTLKISNIFSFPFSTNIDECQEIIFDDTLNIFVGPNGSGKSNLLEIVNQIYKKIMIKNFEIHESNIAEYARSPTTNNLTATVTVVNKLTNLEKNRNSNSNTKEIKIKIELTEDDYSNLSYIIKNIESLKFLSLKYSSNEIPNYQLDNSITADTIKSKKILTLHWKSQENHPFILETEQLDKIDNFIIDYLKFYRYYNFIALIGNKYEALELQPLKNTFGFIGGYRSYNLLSPSYKIDKQEQDLLIAINNEIIEENTKESTNKEPPVFNLVKHKLSYEYENYLDEMENAKGKAPKTRMIQNELYNSINELLNETLNLSFKLEKEYRSTEYNFYFENNETKQKVEFIQLSAGE